MKAVQEKRISLRSIWRRSLVVLSVVALAFSFAACGDDSGSGSGGGGGDSVDTREVIAITVITQPSILTSSTTFAHEGLPVDLTGIRAVVRYADNTTRTVTDPSEFYVNPPVFIRHGSAGTGEPREYQIGLSMGGISAPLTVPDNKLRYLLPGMEGIRYTGNISNREFYSDDLPDFSGITVELRHFEGGGSVGREAGTERRQQTRFTVPRNYAYWAYSTPGTANPFIIIAIPTINVANATNAPNDFDFTQYYIEIPVGAIWFADSITVTPGTYDPVFFDDYDQFRFNNATMTSVAQVNGILNSFDPNGADGKWLERLRAAGSTITVTYRGGAPATKTFTFDEAMSMRPGVVGEGGLLQVGSHNPGGGVGCWTGQGTGGWQHDLLVMAPERAAITVSGITQAQGNALFYGGTHATGRDPRVRVNYRGMPFDLPVDVYTRAQGITAELLVDPLYIDTRIGLDAPAPWTAFGSRLRVTATYELGRDASITTARTLTINPVTPNDRGWGGGGPGGVGGFYDIVFNNGSGQTARDGWLAQANNIPPRTNRMQIRHTEAARTRQHNFNLDVLVYR